MGIEHTKFDMDNMDRGIMGSNPVVMYTANFSLYQYVVALVRRETRGTLFVFSVD